MNRQHARRGFTLLEMSIALALGTLIVVVAFSGFRVASQTVTMANRLSLQNAMLRSAVMAANEEMDTWESFDSRSDTSKQVLRGATFPFAQMDFKAADTVLDFNPGQARLWWNGVLWSANRLDDDTNYQRRFGDYSIFGRKGMDTIKDKDGKSQKDRYEDLAKLITGPTATEETAIKNSLLAVPGERAWRHRILPYLSDNLGYYAAFDYLPANFVYGYYNDRIAPGSPAIPGVPATATTPAIPAVPAVPASTIGDIPIEFGTPGVGPGRFRPNWHGGNKPLQKVEAGHDNGYILTNVSPTSDYPHTHTVSHRASYNDSSTAGFTDTKYPDRFDAFPKVDFTTVLPTMWPTVKMQVKATYSWMDFRHQVRIEQTDPYTGATTAMVLHGMTTTLRGARRQRGLDLEPTDANYP